jgi:hypothetical protein
MKKLIYGTLFLALVGIGIVGCKKKIIEPLNQKESKTEQSNLKSLVDSNISTDGTLLVFNTLKDYENLWTPNEENPSQSESDVAQFIDLLPSLNYSKFKTSNNFITMQNAGIIEEFPTLIFELLNKDGAIQVGTHVFYFDFIGRKGYAIKVADKASAYADLIAGNISNSKVQKYNWEDEMIVWANEPEAKIGCSENGANTTEDTKTYTDKIEWAFLLNGNVFQNTANASVQYKKFDGELKAKYRWTPGGWDFYSKVVVREKTQNLSGNTGGQITYTASWTTANIPVKLEWQRRYKLKCKNDTGYQSVNNFGTGIATGQSWHGIRACSKYIMGANAYAQINGNWVLMAFGNPVANVNGTLYQVRINQGY